MIFAIVAVLVMVVVMSFDYEWWKRARPDLLRDDAGAAVLVFLSGDRVGRTGLGFDFGPLNFQPAEIAKFTTLLMLASYLAEERADEVSYAAVPRRL